MKNRNHELTLEMMSSVQTGVELFRIKENLEIFAKMLESSKDESPNDMGVVLMLGRVQHSISWITKLEVVCQD